MTALAIKAGLPTLSADRAAAAIAAAVGRAPSSEVQLWAALDDGFVVLTLSGDGEHWCDQILARLDGWDATAVGEKVVVRLARTPLRAVSNKWCQAPFIQWRRVGAGGIMRGIPVA